MLQCTTHPHSASLSSLSPSSPSSPLSPLSSLALPFQLIFFVSNTNQEVKTKEERKKTTADCVSDFSPPTYSVSSPSHLLILSTLDFLSPHDCTSSMLVCRSLLVVTVSLLMIVPTSDVQPIYRACHYDKVVLTLLYPLVVNFSVSGHPIGSDSRYSIC